MAGGYNPLKDAYKTTVFAIAKWRNAHAPRLSRNPVFPVMPGRIITKPPSAELRPDQKDEDSLPPYEDLDRMLHMLVEEEASVDRSEEHTSELQSLMRISYADFCLKKKKTIQNTVYNPSCTTV